MTALFTPRAPEAAGYRLPTSSMSRCQAAQTRHRLIIPSVSCLVLLLYADEPAGTCDRWRAGPLPLSVEC
jgi:hypothetical protein